ERPPDRPRDVPTRPRTPLADAPHDRTVRGRRSLTPSFRALPLGGPARLSTVWFAGDRERLQVATSAVGLGIDLTGEVAQVTASHEDLLRLCAELEREATSHAPALRRYLEPLAQWRTRTRSFPLDAPLI